MVLKVKSIICEQISFPVICGGPLHGRVGWRSCNSRKQIFTGLGACFYRFGRFWYTCKLMLRNLYCWHQCRIIISYCCLVHVTGCGVERACGFRCIWQGLRLQEWFQGVGMRWYMSLDSSTSLIVGHSGSLSCRQRLLICFLLKPPTTQINRCKLY